MYLNDYGSEKYGCNRKVRFLEQKYLTSSMTVIDLEMLFWRALNLLSFCHDKKLEPNEPESRGPNFL